MLPHPALRKLMALRYVGRVSSLSKNFANPRRIVVSILGALLAVVWMGNAVASIMFREQYDPEIFRQWLLVMLTGYAGWHLVRVAWQKPEEGIEWTPAEADALMSAPFTRRQLVGYRLATVLVATTLKATVGTILLLPDLQIPLVGFCGLWLGLAFIEMIRLTCDLVAFTTEPKHHRWYRNGIVTLFVCGGMAVLLHAVSLMQQAPVNDDIPAFFVLLSKIMVAIRESAGSVIGEWITAPFALFVNPIIAERLTFSVTLSLTVGAALVYAMGHLVQRLDHWSQLTLRQRCKTETGAMASPHASAVDQTTSWDLGRDQVLRKAGPVVWRQYVGARRYFNGVVIALLPPAILALMPLFMERFDGPWAFMNFLGALTFYTFVLLPAALKFDFRRDYDHLLRLKLLPCSPRSIVFGQLVTPVVITTAFQYVMIAVACCIRPTSPWIILAAVLAFPPLNYAIYAWENLLFLIFPQRLKQEGIEVFLRTTVVFTAKGIVFALMFVAILLWVSFSAVVAANLGIPQFEEIIRKAMFWTGIFVATVGVGALLTALSAKRFASLDGVAG